MRAYTLKRVILIIVLSILICLCYVMITGCVYANQDNQNRFSKTYVLTGKGAEDMASVAFSQFRKDLLLDLGYTINGSCWVYEAYEIDPFIEFIKDCAELTGQGEAFKNAPNSKNPFIMNIVDFNGAVEVTEPKAGDIVIAREKSNEYYCYAGIMIGDSSFLTVPGLYNRHNPDQHYIDLKPVKEFEADFYKISYYRPKYQDSPSACGPMEIKGKTVTVSRSKLKKKSQSFNISKALSISGCKDGLTFKKIRGSKNIIINKKTGRVTVRKGLKKKTYKVTVEVSAKGADGTEPLTAKATFKVRVR